MRILSLLVPALMFWTSGPALGGQVLPTQQPETTLASATSGSLQGAVLDEAGAPLHGAVVSALGLRTVFAVTDTAGHYRLRELPPGPYLLRVHLDGFTSARGTMVNVRAAVRTASSFTLRRTGVIDASRLAAASVGAADDGSEARALPEGNRDEGETAWRLRRLRRSILKESTVAAVLREEDERFLAEPLQFLRDAVGSSAKLASSYLTSGSLQGQLRWMTTGAFDDPAELLQLERTRGATLFSLGAPVAAHGDWQLRGALNRGDLSSWVVAGSYVVRAPATHRYNAGMSYGAQHYEGGNALALAAMPEGARNVGSIFGSDQWAISRAVTVGYGVHYAHHDYMDSPALFSPHVSATVAVTAKTHLRASAARRLTAPGGEEFLPPRRAELMPPQRTFSPLTAGGFRTQTTEHYELALERVTPHATVAARTFRQQVGNQMATLFGLGGTETGGGALGHYIVASTGVVTMQGAAVSVTHAIGRHLRGSAEYSFSTAHWVNGPRASEAITLAAAAPSVLRQLEERLHDVTTSIEAEVPVTATRVFVLYRVSNGFADDQSLAEDARLAARFDVQVNQTLPLRNFLRARWEATISVRNVFREAIDAGSPYDELLVVRPPKRVVGGLTVSF